MTGLAWVTVGSLLANLCSYLVHLPASRWLGPAEYSEFASLLALSLLFAVPALALQNVVARQLVRGAGGVGLRRLGYRIAAGTAVVAVAVSPLVAAGLHTAVLTTLAALASAPVLALLAVEQGLLQGRCRFGRLAVLLGGAGLAKVVPTVPALALGTGPALAAMAVGAAVAAGAGRLLVGALPPDGQPGTGGGTDATGSGSQTPGVRAVLAAGAVQLVLTAFASLDVLLSRPVLGFTAAGSYALGAIAAKVAFWLPQAVGVVFYPQLAAPEGDRGALRRMMVWLGALGAVCVVGAAAAAPLAPLLVGPEYAAVQGWFWLFAAQGALLALLQGLLLFTIATTSTRLASIAWVGLAAEAVALLTVPNGLGQMIALSTVCVAATVAVLTAAIAWRARR